MVEKNSDGPFAYLEEGARGRIHVVGIPPGRTTPAEDAMQRLISRADLLVGREDYLAPWPGIPSLRLGRDWLKAVELAEERRAEGKLVIFLASGDPLFFGIGSALVRKLGPERVVIYPAVSSMQLAFARIGESWSDADFFSAHSGPLEEVVEDIAVCSKACVFTAGAEQPRLLAEALLERRYEDFEVYLCENLGLPDERITRMSLKELAGSAYSPLNLLVLMKKGPGRERPERDGCLLGLADEEFLRLPGKEGMMTKRELRAIVLSRLRLRRGDTLWDVGAGSGAVSVEASRMTMGSGRVFAVEKDPLFLELIRKNVAHLSPSVKVVPGEAPEALNRLPDPNAVFVGGSGGRLEDTLKLCFRRLKPGGRLVADFASPERAMLARAILVSNGMDVDLFLFQGARLRGTAGGELLSALNPVFVVSASKG